MKTFRTITLLFATIALVPALALAGPTQAGTTQKPPAKTPAAATHSVAGVVKSVDAASLVIETVASGKEKAKELTFVLTPATQKKGTIAVGATVDIRYQTEGGKNTATAVTVKEKK
jgi:hypothetical protein